MRSQDGSVGIDTGWTAEESARYLSLAHSVQTESDAHPTSYPMCNSDYFPGGIKQEKRESENARLSHAEVKIVEVVHPLHYMSSWPGS
jgi:hypothetical protein